MKKLICRLFGHRTHTVQYAQRYAAYGRGGSKWRRDHPKNKYAVIHETECTRCGRIDRLEFGHGLSRAELLKAGFFIEK